MSRFDSHPSTKEIILRKLVPFALIGSAAITGSACSATEHKPTKGEIVCTDVQSFTAETDETYSELIAQHTKRDIDPADFLHLQYGIEGEYLAHNGDLPDTFIIPGGAIDTPRVTTVAGKEYEIPTSCDLVE